MEIGDYESKKITARPVSNFKSQISQISNYLNFQISNISNFKYLKFQISNLKSQISNISRFKFQISISQISNLHFAFCNLQFSSLFLHKHRHHIPYTERSLITEHLMVSRLLPNASQRNHDRSITALAGAFSQIGIDVNYAL